MAEKNMNAKISVEFEETANRQQLSSGDNLPILFGKIKKFFTDLKPVALSGSYNDLENKPESLPASDVSAWAKAETKPTYTASEVGADPSGTATNAINALNVTDTTVDGKYVSAVSESKGKITVTRKSLPDYSNTYDAKGSADAALASAKSHAETFTNQKIAELVNSAPTTLDTLGEIATAMEENADVVDALEKAVGNKANASDLTSHVNNKSNPHTVTKAQVGLGNVENKSSATIRSEITKENVTDALGYTPPDSDEATESESGLMSAADKIKLNATNIGYGTCSTAAGTAEKVITLVDNDNWKLDVGSTVIVKFTATNTAQNPTLNVNGTGAKSIWYNTAVITTRSLSYAGTANRPMKFVYDGTNYIFMGWSVDNNTTYTNASLGQGYGTCSTAAATVAKVVTLSSYALTTGGIVAVKFTNAVPASATMNINSKGAKAIYYRGAAITANVIKAGDIGVFIYNGSQYHLLTVDRDSNTTYSQATSSTLGLVKIGYTESGKNYPVELNSDGQMFVNVPWKNTTYSNFGKSGSGAKAGLVPAPSTTAGTTKYLREDGTWAVPPDNNTTYSNMTAATASATGKAGLVPAPAAGKQSSFLRGDGTWAEVTATNAEKVSIQKLDAPSTGTAYYPAFVDSNNTTATSETLYTNNGVKWTLKGGTTTVEGYALMSLGNGTLAGSNGNMKGQLQFYNNTNEYYAVVQQSTSQTGNISVNLPTVSGTLALLSSTVSKANYQSSTAGTSPNASYLRQIASGTTEATTTNCPAGCLYGQYS